MKKWIALLALMCLCTVSGCTKKETPRSPTETTAAFLNGIQNQAVRFLKNSEIRYGAGGEEGTGA